MEIIKSIIKTTCTFMNVLKKAIFETDKGQIQTRKWNLLIHAVSRDHFRPDFSGSSFTFHFPEYPSHSLTGLIFHLSLPQPLLFQ